MQQLITKVSEVTTVLQTMDKWWTPETAEMYSDSGKINLQLVKSKIDFVRHKVIANNFYSSWSQFFIQVGGMMLELGRVNKQNFDPVLFGEFLLAKHRAYGAEPFADWREIGVLMRLGSKMARLINIAEDPDIEVKSENESFQDTFKDVIGYCVLGYYINRLPK